MDSYCVCCAARIPFDGLVRQRQRTRRCAWCIGRLRRERLDPLGRIHRCWAQTVRRRGYRRALQRLEVVERVWARCHGRSVVSGCANPAALCVASRSANPRDEAALVLVTTREAMALAHRK
jgi:hypothetical protein